MSLRVGGLKPTLLGFRIDTALCYCAGVMLARWLLALAFGCALSTPAGAFVTLRRTTPDAAALRWSAARHAIINGAGLYDGIQVAIEAQFAERLALAVTGATDPADVADVRAALAASFRAWESPVLRFEITFDGPAERGELLGSELDVFLVPETDEVFTNNSYFGVTYTESSRVEDRLLTNGMVSSGPAITGADIYINETILASVAPALTRVQQLAALQRLMMHEIGHALGLHHPNEFPESNYDTDSDPLNAMHIDPDDPTAGLQLSPNVNPNSVVSNRLGSFDALLFTTLQNDERGGRDVLYPLHAPVCPGDCDDNRSVAVNELVQTVNIALERADIAACEAADYDYDTRIRVDEIVAAVRSALAGCRADRLLVALDEATHLQAPLPFAITGGTIRLEVIPAWELNQTVTLVDFREPVSSVGIIQLMKFGPEVRLITQHANGSGNTFAVSIDGWAANERHEITATWTRNGTEFYVDGELYGESRLREPFVLTNGSTVRIGVPAVAGVLENVRIFGRP